MSSLCIPPPALPAPALHIGFCIALISWPLVDPHRRTDSRSALENLLCSSNTHCRFQPSGTTGSSLACAIFVSQSTALVDGRRRTRYRSRRQSPTCRGDLAQTRIVCIPRAGNEHYEEARSNIHRRHRCEQSESSQPLFSIQRMNCSMFQRFQRCAASQRAPASWRFLRVWHLCICSHPSYVINQHMPIGVGCIPWAKLRLTKQ